MKGIVWRDSVLRVTMIFKYEALILCSASPGWDGELRQGSLGNIIIFAAGLLVEIKAVVRTFLLLLLSDRNRVFDLAWLLRELSLGL